MINNHKTNKTIAISSTVLVLILVISSVITTNSQAQEVTPTNNISISSELPANLDELEYIEDNTQTFYPTDEDRMLSDDEVTQLGLESKLNKKALQDLNLNFKVDFRSQLNLKSGTVKNITGQAELDLLADSINQGF